MNFRILALGALTLTALVPAAIATPAAAANSDAHSCIFQPKSDRDGTSCNPFSSMSAELQDHGLKVVVTKKAIPLDYVNTDTRGSSMQR